MAIASITPILPGASVPNVQASPGTPDALTAPRGVLSTLAPGTIISGFVLNRDDQGNPILRSSGGDFLLQSNFFLKIGSDVTVRIDATGKNFRASILTVDGLPPEQAEHVSSHAQDTDVVTRHDAQNARDTASGTRAEANIRSGQAALQTAPQARLDPSRVTGTITYPNPEAGAEIIDGALQPGTQLQLKLLTVSYPDKPAGQQPAEAPPGASQAPTPTAAPAGNNPGSVTSAAPVAATSTGAQNTETPETANPVAPASSPPAAGSPLAQQYGVYARLAGQPQIIPTPQSQAAIPTLPTAPTPGQTATASATPLVATVVGFESGGEPLVQTALGMVRLNGNISLPLGSTILFNIDAALPPALPDTAEPTTIATLAAGWQSLQQIAGVSAAADDPNGADALLRSLLPQFSDSPLEESGAARGNVQGFGGAVLAFMQALRNGDFRQWLGSRTASALEAAGHGSLLKKAEGEFASLRDLFLSPSNSWQALFVPVMVDGEIKPVRYFVKRERGKMSENEEGSNTHFVLETELSELGPLQLDGFVKKREGGTQFDLVIRSGESFTPEEQQEIIGIYHNAGELTGFQGTLMFQTTREFPINPMEEIMTDKHRKVVA